MSQPHFLQSMVVSDTRPYSPDTPGQFQSGQLAFELQLARLIRCDAGWRASRCAGATKARASEAFCFTAGSGLWGGRWRLSGTGYRGDSGPIGYGPVGINPPA